MSDIKELQDAAVRFRDEREWKQYHSLKDMALGLSVEAGELLELFLYKKEEEVLEKFQTDNTDLSDELSDVMWWVLLISREFDIDLKEAFLKKLEKNAKKYPIEKSKGKSTKYTDL